MRSKSGIYTSRCFEKWLDGSLKKVTTNLMRLSVTCLAGITFYQSRWSVADERSGHQDYQEADQTSWTQAIYQRIITWRMEEEERANWACTIGLFFWVTFHGLSRTRRVDGQTDRRTDGRCDWDLAAWSTTSPTLPSFQTNYTAAAAERSLLRAVVLIYRFMRAGWTKLERGLFYFFIARNSLQ